MRKILLFFFLFVFSGTYAEHIIGGDFTIDQIGPNEFACQLVLFSDGNSATVDFSLTGFIFDAVTDENVGSFTFSDMVSEDIPLGNSCYEPDINLTSRTYTGIINLADNPNGYYLSWERCCRNGLSDNIVDENVPMVFTVSVPDPAIQNSTPAFGPYPAEGYFCMGVVNQLDFSATDADGDSIVYSLTTPLAGTGTSSTAPTTGIANPRPYLPVSWVDPYNELDQVGGLIPMTIDPVTGIITAEPDVIGIYSIAVLVEEYRDGVKIGEIQREIQVAALICNFDEPSEITFEPAPEQDTVYTIFANLPFCIDVNVTDPNTGDALVVQAESEILDGTILPSATFPEIVGLTPVEGEFCWTPLCHNVRDEPYAVTFTAFSDGCSPEPIVTEYTIYIYVTLEVNEPTALTGPSPDARIDLYNPASHCFNIIINDPNNSDSLFVNATSDLFELPNADLIGFTVDQGQVTINYCWDVTCEDVRDEPYFIEFDVITTNCEVLDTSHFVLPVYVEVPDDVASVFVAPAQTINWEFYSQPTFCFPVQVVDGNFFDSLQVTATSEIFELEGNPAVFDTINGFIDLESTLCWTPTCDDVREEPYIVTFKATANSCKTDEEVLYEVEIYLTLPEEEEAYFQFPDDQLSITHFIGDSIIDIPVSVIDNNINDTIHLSASSSAFSVEGSPPVFEDNSGVFNVNSDFFWKPNCYDTNPEPYVVTFMANSKSCQKNAQISVDVLILVTTPSKGYLEPIANVITPNGDDKNDFWTVEDKNDKCILEFNTNIFDRWGTVVYQTGDPAFLWNGEYSNSGGSSDGTYFYTIEYLYKDEKRNYTGNLNILR